MVAFALSPVISSAMSAISPRSSAWRRPYKTKDGYLCMMAYTELQWRKFWGMVGKPEVCDDPRFVDIAARSRNVVALYGLNESPHFIVVFFSRSGFHSAGDIDSERMQCSNQL